MSDPEKPGLARAFGFLFFLGLLCFAVFIPRLGFYSDDWPLLETMSRGGRWGALGAWIKDGSLWTRPFEMFQYSFFYLLGGAHPAPQHLLLFIIGLLESLLLFLLLDRLLGRRSLALSAGTLAYLYPNRAVFHVWFANSPQSTAHVLALGSLLSHLRWRDGRGSLWLACSLSLFLAAILSYESILFLPVLLAVAIVSESRSPIEGGCAALGACVPYLLPIILALGWQWAGTRLLFGHVNPKSQGMSISFGHMLKAYAAGFECVTNRTIHLSFKNILAMKDWGWLRLTSCFAAIFAVYVAVKVENDREEASSNEIKVALALAAAAFIAGYAPYALSGSYTPQIFGLMSRTNAIGAWAGGLLIAALLALCRPFLRRILFTLTLSVFLCANWATNLDWTHAWALQQEIIAKIAPAARDLPPSSSVLLAQAPHFAGYAVVFDSSYDFDAALRLSTGRRDLKGIVAPPECENCYRYDFPSNRWEPPENASAKQ